MSLFTLVDNFFLINLNFTPSCENICLKIIPYKVYLCIYTYKKISMHGFINSGGQYTQWHRCKCERTVITTGQSIRIITSYHTRTTALKGNIKLKTCDNTISVGYLENQKHTQKYVWCWDTWRRILQIQ